MAYRRAEAGFTLIELQVVVLIIGLLAAIAIPIFLAQRDKAYKAQVQSALKNAAIAQESYLTEPSSGGYTAIVNNLRTMGGLKYNQAISLSVPQVNGALSYCIEASHSAVGETWHYSSASGEPLLGPC